MAYAALRLQWPCQAHSPPARPPCQRTHPLFALAKAVVPLIISARPFFAPLQASALLYCLAFTLQASACIAPPLVASLRRASLAFARLGQARLGLQFRKKKASL
jgi:hypothetical protein